MANNQKLWNAVVAGYMGGSGERAYESQNEDAYSVPRDAAQALADAVDVLISHDATVGPSKQNLMQSIVQGYFAGRYTEFNQASQFQEAAGAIATAYASVAPVLYPDAGGGGSSSFQLDEFGVESD